MDRLVIVSRQALLVLRLQQPQPLLLQPHHARRRQCAVTLPISMTRAVVLLVAAPHILRRFLQSHVPELTNSPISLVLHATGRNVRADVLGIRADVRAGASHQAEQTRVQEAVQAVKYGVHLSLERAAGAKCLHVRHRAELTPAVLPANICAMVCVNRRAIQTVLVVAAHLVRVQAVKPGARALRVRAVGARCRRVRHQAEPLLCALRANIGARVHHPANP